MSHPFATTEGLDISEQGRTADGEVVRLDRRLFMQLYAFGECYRTDDIVESLPRLRSFALSGATRSAVKADPELLPGVERAVRAATGA